ncbi:hypothetical protein NDU88_013267 [Pleurodeles waltl]|uniref:Uncharacterized protein n=1 Tax=Pleurodeles waltl TaxID=8319 RepID=A0AAV7R399_PLEWA|nr:hypothetical protein NDU88_013267 [Pleurodeles waltl]
MGSGGPCLVHWSQGSGGPCPVHWSQGSGGPCPVHWSEGSGGPKALLTPVRALVPGLRGPEGSADPCPSTGPRAPGAPVRALVPGLRGPEGSADPFPVHWPQGSRGPKALLTPVRCTGPTGSGGPCPVHWPQGSGGLHLGTRERWVSSLHPFHCPRISSSDTIWAARDLTRSVRTSRDFPVEGKHQKKPVPDADWKDGWLGRGLTHEHLWRTTEEEVQAPLGARAAGTSQAVAPELLRLHKLWHRSCWDFTSCGTRAAETSQAVAPELLGLHKLWDPSNSERHDHHLQLNPSHSNERHHQQLQANHPHHARDHLEAPQRVGARVRGHHRDRRRSGGGLRATDVRRMLLRPRQALRMSLTPALLLVPLLDTSWKPHSTCHASVSWIFPQCLGRGKKCGMLGGSHPPVLLTSHEASTLLMTSQIASPA